MGADKLWLDVAGRPLLALTLDAIAAAACFEALVVAAPEQRWEEVRALVRGAGFPALQLVSGGSRRQDSVATALDLCAASRWVCVHDAARPLAPASLFREVLAAAQEVGAATAGVPCVDSIKEVTEQRVTRTLDRSTLVAVQTPQAFATPTLVRAHDTAVRDGVQADDDAYLVERLGLPVAVVPGAARNLKVTLPHDLAVVRALLQAT